MTKSEFEELQSRFNASGMTLKSFLKAEGIPYSTYNYWNHRSKENERRLPIAPIEFRHRSIAEEMTPSMHGVALPGVTLAFPNGVRAFRQRQRERPDGDVDPRKIRYSTTNCESFS